MRRVIGLETEYGLALATPVAAGLEKIARTLFLPIKQYQNSSNAFLENGGRLYLDVGWHPEYASAECDLLGDLLAQDLAGDQLLNQLLATLDPKYAFSLLPDTASAHTSPAAVATWRFNNHPELTELAKNLETNRIHIFKNNLDYEHNSYGCHENYLLDRRQDIREIADTLVTFLVTRTILVGSGHLNRDGNWSFSQRAQTITQAVSPTTTHTRPIINTRDEALADATRYRRLHVIIGDSNLAEATNLLKIAATALLLNALEQGIDFTDLILKDPIASLYALDKIPWALLETETGKKLSAVDIQEEICQRLIQAKILDQYLATDLPATLTPAEKQTESQLWQEALQLWEKALNCFWRGHYEGEDFTPVATELDWVIKRRLLEETQERYGLEATDAKLARLELAYHDITAAGLRKYLRACGKMRSLIEPERILAAYAQAPKTTRAHLRGKAISLAQQNRRDLNVDWLHLRLNGSNLETITLSDPLMAEEEKISTLLAELEE